MTPVRIRAVLLSLFILLSVAVQHSAAQTILQGTVVDATSKEQLVGANVLVKGTAIGGITDIEGHFRIPSVPSGAITLRVTYLGYKPLELPLTITAGETRSLTASLVPDVIEGQEVVITAQARGQVAAINQQLTSQRIVNVVSEEKIKELPDANAAEAIGRLPGIALVRSGGEATKVVLRGLSSKFSNITVDGVKIPATDASSRDVDLSTISQGSLAGIELYKTLTPDQDADAIAGAVNLVTRKAPSLRSIVLDAKGDYNHLMKSAKQYDISLRYGERFFEDLIGVQIQGNVERKIRSKENIDYSYTMLKDTATSAQNSPLYDDYKIKSFTVDFTDEIRLRNGIQGIFDINTPDSGSVKLSTMFSGTGRDITSYSRVYPGAGSNDPWDYNYRYQEQKISTSNMSLQGKNYLAGFDVDWSLSFAQSRVENPYDLALKFTEGNGALPGLQVSRDRPDLHNIPFARNDFSAAACSTAVYRMQENYDKERTGFINVMKKYVLADVLAGEVKFGAKSKSKSRWRSNSELDDNSYLHSLATVGLDSNRVKNSRFLSYYQNGAKFGAPSLADFIDGASGRDLLGVYHMNPLINVDAMKLWYDITKGAVVNGEVEYLPNASAALESYTIQEGVTSAYLMNTLNYGQELSLMVGARLESESNDYTTKFSTGSISNIGIRYSFTDTPRDSTIHFKETNILPNALLTVRPTDYLTFRLAGYQALARPDFTMRMPTFAVINSSSNVTLGNPDLKDTKAWNFELNTQVFGKDAGLISVSLFYKKLDNLFHEMTNVQVDKQYLDVLFKGVGLRWLDTAPFSTMILRNPSSFLNLPYNSSSPSYAWGVEFEHQLNYSFMALDYVNTVTLSYNVSVTRSETNIIGNETLYRTDSNFVRGRWLVTQTPYHISKTFKRQSEGQPKLYGNASLGYDLGGFSARLSYFYQDEYVKSYSSDGQSDVVVDPFSKFDLVIRQKLDDNISVFLNINNLTNVEETTSYHNQIKPWTIANTAELYGRTIDFGVKVSL